MYNVVKIMKVFVPPWDVPFMACSMVNFSTGQPELPEHAFSQGHSSGPTEPIIVYIISEANKRKQ
jgi:hypothetical protein